MKYFNLFAFLLLMTTGMQISNAQESIKRGYLKLEITDIQSDNEQMMAMSGMLKGSYTEIYFTPERSLTKANMMGGMSQTTVLVDQQNKSNNIMLMSIMGQKVLIRLTDEELEEMQSGQNQEQIEYIHFRDEKREILGFQCHKVQVKVGDTQEMGMILWVTEDIQTDAHVTNGIQVEKLGGFPLEYVISMAGQLDMTMTATKLEREVKDSVFEVKIEGYKEMTFEEFMESMGAMGGGF